MSTKYIPREWSLRAQACEDFSGLKQQTGLSDLALRVCVNRGLSDSESITRFLSPKLETLTPPSRIKDLDQAVSRVAQARSVGEKIRVFGDYDVDGTTGAALLSWIFREAGIQYEARQPDRFKDGYGLNVKAVEEAAQDGARVLVTVDCGITSFDAADRAQALGIDLIVIDHHQLDPKKGLPPAYAVVNPQRSDCESGLKQLCGCGLAFYFAMGLRALGRQEGWWTPGSEPNLKQHLDLVVMATAADMVPLTGDNHVLVRHGLEILKYSKKPGVRALMSAAGIGERDLTPGHLGFVIGPRINASGRMQSASLALELLTTQDSARATSLAQELERLNAERAELQNRIWDEVRARIETGLKEGRYQHGIVVADSAWHEGVVGIVASRVVDTYRRPAAVIALREDFGKGSVRTFAGKDVLAALRECSADLLGFGGHKHAAGFSVALDRVDALALAFDSAVARLSEDADARPLMIDGDCRVEELTVAALQEIEKLGPFGPGNPEPVFAIEAQVRSQKILKERHLKMGLSGSSIGEGDTQPSSTIEAIWFHGAEHEEVMQLVTREGKARWAGVPELNRFRGRVTPTFRIRDFQQIRG